MPASLFRHFRLRTLAVLVLVSLLVFLAHRSTDHDRGHSQDRGHSRGLLRQDDSRPASEDDDVHGPGHVKSPRN
jgi:hypothetical protein